MQKTNRVNTLFFLAGFEAFHALVHGYLSATKTKLKGHPAEALGIDVNPRFHAIASLLNAAIATGLGVMALKSRAAAKLT